jgi:hypothetical protein
MRTGGALMSRLEAPILAVGFAASDGSYHGTTYARGASNNGSVLKY